MDVKDVIAKRFQQLCRERDIRPNELATLSGVTPSTVYSMLNPVGRNISVVTVKNLCDGLGITLGDFFNTPEFDALDQEIK